jgi:hypothetical protein
MRQKNGIETVFHNLKAPAQVVFIPSRGVKVNLQLPHTQIGD